MSARFARGLVSLATSARRVALRAHRRCVRARNAAGMLHKRGRREEGEAREMAAVIQIRVEDIRDERTRRDVSRWEN